MADTSLTPTIICSWCQRELSPGLEGHGTSHGICPPCERTVLEQDARLGLGPFTEDDAIRLALANALEALDDLYRGKR